MTTLPLLLPVLLSLLLCLGFPPLASPFSYSFVVVQDRHSIPGKQHRHSHRSTALPTAASTARFAFLREEDIEQQQLQATGGTQSRRSMVWSVVAGVITSGVVNTHLKHAFAANANAATMDVVPEAILGTADRPVVIVGGGGRTGMAVAEAVADPAFGNMHAITLSRSGRDPFGIIKLPQATKDHLKHNEAGFDVRDSQETLSASLKTLSPSVVVYAASASRQGGTTSEVDDAGVEKVARACKEIGAVFVLISALAVDRPDSKSFQMTNTLGGNYQGIMDAKYNGEVKTRTVFSSSGGKTAADYVIVRPGVLLNGKTTTGPVGLELNQGDTIGGGLSRDELAGVVVGAIQSRASSKKGSGQGITVEAYRKSTAQKLERQYTVPSGNELTVDASKALALASSTSSSSSSKISSPSLYRELFASAKLD